VKSGKPGADQELWAAVGPAGAVSLGVYTIQGGSLSGAWLPGNAMQDRPAIGFENLSGAARLGGVYKITSARLPNGGAAYTGALNIDPLASTLSGNVKCYRIRWTNGATAVGFATNSFLAVATGSGADWEILRFKPDNTGISVESLNKSGAPGGYTVSR
jgi:hypothetical protein